MKNPLEKMEAYVNYYSDTDIKIYEKIKSDPYYVIQSGIVGLADWCSVSQPSITRFCQKIGYSKFSDFKQEMYLFVLSKEDYTERSLKENTFLNNFIQLGNMTDEVLSIDVLDDFSNALLQHQSIYFTGIVESGIVGRLLTYKLRRFGLKCFFVEPTELNDTVFFSQPTDLIVIFSARGPVKGNILGEFMKRSDRFNGEIFLVTMNSEYRNNSISKKILLPNLATFHTSPNLVFQYFAEKLINNIAKNIQ
ncbi:MurR/RpiR family transcriptional regulator [Listeria seeligeri]|uniref:MurR/RpiR family transcriptional regulator n=1 Tax=Listeria seeligeri TaxID=1640 RepID=UPI0016256D52|nr:MurR/RpiR family transcriptional regulator [Listeria seeligeri]MBC1480330.1 MurR/RpiR family transcriptional regulator [Listeria seeligeri]MBC1532453.1 MurR/RpiR family transcriptional regulator [Listeria seeligeri]MBC1721553.1 MurR/RpiR family transcriptional regulator [Listeria seeligeri]MBC1728463.1 MurR/RpiR family transcriptional regulator [Listeria seeligeri]MBC1739663.1 MurR/RpiR family transcriptional regulator [Listeria seeligeri]